MRHVFGKESWMVAAALLAVFLQVDARAEAKAGDHFGDWVLECPTMAGKTVCLLSQTVVTAKEQRRIAKLSIHKGAAATESTFTVLLPLGIYLPAGATMTYAPGGKEAPRQIPLVLQACMEQGCIASAKMDVTAFKGVHPDGKLSVSFTPRPGIAPVVLSGSVKGLADGMAALHD